MLSEKACHQDGACEKGTVAVLSILRVRACPLDVV